MDVKLASYVLFVGYNEILTIFILFSFYTTFSDILQQFYLAILVNVMYFVEPLGALC
jgi:hypothetical protein